MLDARPANVTRFFGQASRLIPGQGKAAPQFWRLGHGAPPSGSFVALVPGAEAPLLFVSLPDALKGAAREGVALRQLRDRLGMDAGRLVLRPALLGRNTGWSHVLAAERDAVAAWRAQLQAARGRCRAILPDYLSLPAASGLWTIQTEETADGIMVQARLGPADGFSAEASLATHLLEHALDRARAQGALPAAVLRLGVADTTLDAVLEGLPVYLSADALPPTLPAPQILAHGEGALDLGHDPLADAEAAQARVLGLRWPLVLAVGGFAAWALAVELQTRNDLAMAAALDTVTVETVRRDFLPSGPLLDIPTQVSRELDRRRTPETAAPEPASPLDRLHVSSQSLAASPASLVSLLLQSDNDLTLELELPDFIALETLVEDLRANGLPARTIRSGTEQDGRITATIRIADEGGQ